MGPKRVEMMSKVWALVFLSLLLIEPSASLALAEDSGASSKSLSSGSSGSMGKPQPMQIGAGDVLGLLVGGGGGSSSGAKGGGLSASSPSSKKDAPAEEGKAEGQSGEEEDGEGMFD